MTQKQLAAALDRSLASIASMQKEGMTLDSLARRRALARLLDIPPVLLRLDPHHWPQPPASWWQNEGYAAFAEGDDGYPVAGQVVRKYRKILRKEDGRTWTLDDLASVLEISERATRSMERLNASLDSISRRRALVEILSIPPVLLGLASLDELQQTMQKTLHSMMERTASYNLDFLVFEEALHSYWQTNHSNTARHSVREIKGYLTALHRVLPYQRSAEAIHTLSLLCRYHQLLANILRDQGAFVEALAQLDQALLLTKALDDDEQKAIILFRRGGVFRDRGTFEDKARAVADFDTARTLESFVSPSLRAAILIQAGDAHACIARDETDKKKSIQMIDMAGRIVRQGILSDDEHFLHIDELRYHLDRGLGLIALDWSKMALEELDLIDRDANSRFRRRHAYADLLAAQAYADQGHYPIAASIAEDTLEVMVALNSRVNIARLARLYEQLRASSYGQNPEALRLGMKLGRAVRAQ